MKVNDPNLSLLGRADASARTQSTAKASSDGPALRPTGGLGGDSDDVHLSELVRSLRALAGDSPERQAYVDQISNTYAAGNYRLDANAAAGRIIDDALGYK